VTVGTSSFYAPYVRDSDLEWTPVGNGTREELLAVLRAQTANTDRTLRVWDYFNNWLYPQVPTSIDHVRAVARGAGYFVSNLRLVMQRDDGETVPGATVTYDPPDDLQEELWWDRQQQPPGKVLNLVSLNKRLMDPDDRWGPDYRFTGYWKPPRPTA